MRKTENDKIGLPATAQTNQTKPGEITAPRDTDQCPDLAWEDLTGTDTRNSQNFQAFQNHGNVIFDTGANPGAPLDSSAGNATDQANTFGTSGTFGVSGGPGGSAAETLAQSLARTQRDVQLQLSQQVLRVH